jgi:EmrB/QacA subfamily drug resistance transporter
VRTRRSLVAVAIGVSTFLSGLDYAVIATAMPTVIGELGGVSLYAWAFASYLLSSTVVVPIFGKLSDLYGRKQVFLAATAIFLIGSILCGLAQRMEHLIVFRAIQGLGAGGVQPITLTIIGDTFRLRDRARMMAINSALWGSAALLGPAIGGFLTEQVSWRWVFLVNVPLCLLAMVLMARFLEEHIERRRRSVDMLGALLLTTAITAFLLGLPRPEADGLAAMPLLLPLAAVLLAVFLWWELRVSEPILPLGVFRHRIIAVGSLNRAILGLALFTNTSFAPPFIQGVLGASPTVAGLVIGCTSLGWTASAAVSARAMLRWGYRVPGAVGGVLLIVGFGLLRSLGPGDPLLLVAGMQVVIGAGYGFLTAVTMLSMQATVGWSQRGVVTSLGQFALTIGGTLGVSVAGAVFAAILGAGGSADVAQLLSPESRAALSPTDFQRAVTHLADAVRAIYTLGVVVAVVATLQVLLLPGGRAEQHVKSDETESPRGGAPAS